MGWDVLSLPLLQLVNALDWSLMCPVATTLLLLLLMTSWWFPWGSDLYCCTIWAVCSVWVAACLSLRCEGLSSVMYPARHVFQLGLHMFLWDVCQTFLLWSYCTYVLWVWFQSCHLVTTMRMASWHYARDWAMLLVDGCYTTQCNMTTPTPLLRWLLTKLPALPPLLLPHRPTGTPYCNIDMGFLKIIGYLTSVL